MIKDTKQTAVVLGLFETGLGVIRSLGRNGIKVIGIDFKKDIGWYSKYVDARICPNPITYRKEFLDWIELVFGNYNTRLPIFITGDDFLKVVSEERRILEKYFLFNLSSIELLDKISNKYEQYQLATTAGISAPATYILRTKEDILKTKGNTNWPLLMKGLDVNSWRKIFGGSVKGFVISDYDSLERQAIQIIEQGIPLILQEIIEGPDTNHYKYCAYISAEGETLAELCLQKIRQKPIHFGVGSVVQSIQNEILVSTGRKFLRSIGYRGVGSAEFKWDQNSGTYKLIELNTRYWQQNALAEACGVNFALINYQDLCGLSPKAVLEHKQGIKWINRYSDFESFLGYRKEKALTFLQWQKSLRGKKVYSDFSWDDPLPILFELGFGKKLFKIPIYLYRKLSK